jgi:hypothetical protein
MQWRNKLSKGAEKSSRGCEKTREEILLLSYVYVDQLDHT